MREASVVEAVIVGPERSLDEDGAAAAEVAAKRLSSQGTAPQPLVKCAAHRKTTRFPRDGRKVVKVSTTELQKILEAELQQQTALRSSN